MKIRKYIDNLPMGVWLSLNDIPNTIMLDVFALLDKNRFETYSITWDEIDSFLFKKNDISDSAILIKKLAYLESNLDIIEWVCIYGNKEDYIITLSNGIIKGTTTKRIDTVFKPETHILTMFEWIYHNATKIDFKYFVT